MENLPKLNLEDIPVELVYDILLRTNPKDIANYCLTSLKAAKVCKDDGFWRMKLWRDYGQQEQMKGMTWKQQYRLGPIRVINSPIAAGNNYYGIIDDQGDVYMAGNNNFGQLGRGTGRRSQRLRKVKLKSKVISLVVVHGTIYTPSVTSAVTEDGEVYVWGNKDTNRNRPNKKPHKLVFPRPGKIIKMSMNNISDIYGVIMDNGVSYLVGGRAETPVLVQPDYGRKIVDLIIPNHEKWFAIVTCFFLDNQGDVYFFVLDITKKEKNIKLHFPDPIRQLSASSDINAALSIKGNVYIWGNTNRPIINYNLIGTPEMSIFNFKIGNYWDSQITSSIYKVNLPVFIESISTGYGNVAAVTSNGTVYVWGSNIRNRLVSRIDQEKLISSGKMIIPWRNMPVIPLPLEIKLKSKIKFISLGNHFTIALTEDGVINYWGDSGLAPENTI